MLDVPAYSFILWLANFSPYVHTLKRRCLPAVSRRSRRATPSNNRLFYLRLAITISTCMAARCRDGAVLWSAALVLRAAAAILALFCAFGAYNLTMRLPWRAVRPLEHKGITYYAQIMPSVLSWPTVALACLCFLALRFFFFLMRPRLARADAVFLPPGSSSLCVLPISQSGRGHILFINLSVYAGLIACPIGTGSIQVSVCSYPYNWRAHMVHTLVHLYGALCYRYAGGGRNVAVLPRRKPMSAFG